MTISKAKRTRKIITLGFTLGVVVLKHWKRKILFKRLNNSVKRNRSGNVHHDRQSILEEIDRLPDHLFKTMFRVDKETFAEILAKVNSAPVLKPDEKQSDVSERMSTINVKNKKGSSISNKIKLMATLRFLGGGIFWDICLAFKIGFGSFYVDNQHGILWPMCHAINMTESIGFDLTNVEMLKKHAEEFAAIAPASAQVFHNVVLAWDGWVMQTRMPFRRELENVMSYRNRHGIWGAVILAACDARTKFHVWNAMNTRSTNDITAWNNSSMKKRIDAGDLPEQFVFIGDEAFSVAHKKWSLLSTVCAKLHNICVDKNIPTVPRYTKDCLADDRELVYVNVTHTEDPTRPTKVNNNSLNGDRRALMTEQLKSMGIQRPLFAFVNSRA